MTRLDLRHEPSQTCWTTHCAIHHVDEPDGRWTYLACRECFHLYPTVWHLRAAYIRAAARFAAYAWRHPELAWSSRWSELASVARALFRRAGSIFACQHCAHDF